MMSKEMLINVSEGEECRIALIENGRLEELYMERTSSTSHVGNIYKGRVTNVEPSIQAAFVDFGLGRNGFLHISDLMPTYFGEGAEDIQESVGRKMARRDRPPIQRCLRRGDEIVVQIIKEGIGTKGPTLSTYLSIPGRILVMMPGMAKMGVSRKIEDEVERRRLRQILDGLEPIDDVGFIIRTAGVGKSKAEIQRDLTYLTRLWQTLVKQRDSGPGPMELYTEGDLVSRTVRDVFTTDVERIVVDNKDVAKRVKDVVKLANPRTRNKVELYEDAVPLFHKYGIESQIEQMHSRYVPLPSGGSLVIDSTEAIVAIDVNSGKFREHNDAEMTAFKTDMEAADEIPRQLRLRDLGGVIICDFIDLRFDRHRRELEQRLHDNFQDDRAKTRVLRMSQFGIIELTRQRMRPSLKRSIYFDCPHCKGAGLVKTPESMSLDAMRRLAIAISDNRVARVEMSVCPDAAFYLQNKKRHAIAELEDRFKKRILIKPDPTAALDEVKLELFDTREGLVYLAELGMSPPPPPGQAQPQGRGRRDGRRDGRGPRDGRGGRDDRAGRDQRGGRPDRQDQRAALPPPRRQDQDDDSHSLDRAEDEVDQREEEMEREPDTTPLSGGDALQGAVENIAEPQPAAEGVQPALPAPPRAAEEHEEDNFGNRRDEWRPQGPPAPQGAGDENGEGGRRRRRRRRGRRGRGGGGGAGDGAGRQGNQNYPPRPAGAGYPNVRQPDRLPPPRPRVEDSRPRRDDPRQGQEQSVGGYVEEFDTGDDESMPFEENPIGENAPLENRRVPEAPASLPAPVEAPRQVAADSAPTDAPQGEESGPRRRRRRGGRGRGRGRSNAAPSDGAKDDAGAPEDSGTETAPEEVMEAAQPAKKPSRRRGGARPRRKPPAKANEAESKATVQEHVVRTGSADRHLASDDPVAPAPVSRPHSFRDLDAIPDDFD